jgi:hypothetical protein
LREALQIHAVRAGLVEIPVDDLDAILPGRERAVAGGDRRISVASDGIVAARGRGSAGGIDDTPDGVGG